MIDMKQQAMKRNYFFSTEKKELINLNNRVMIRVRVAKGNGIIKSNT